MFVVKKILYKWEYNVEKKFIINTIMVKLNSIIQKCVTKMSERKQINNKNLFYLKMVIRQSNKYFKNKKE